jgi:type I restriction enzyme S subunit
MVEKEELKNRLDVSYFTPEVREKLRQLDKLSSKLINLDKICLSINRGRQPIYHDNGEIPIIKTVDISKEGFINWELVTKTDFEFFDKNTLAKVREEDILLTSTGFGSLGKLIFLEKGREAVVDGHITIIRVNKELAIPKFVFIFLKSSFGKVQIDRKVRGSTGQIEIYPTDIKSILIPLPPKQTQEKIIKLYEEFNKKRIELLDNIKASPTKINNLIEEGYEKIMDYLGIRHPKMDGAGDLLIVPPFKITDRLDFMFHKKDCTKMITEIKSSKTPACQLKDMSDFRKERINPEERLDETFNYIEMSDVSNEGIKSYTSLMGRELPSRARNIVHKGDILVPLLLNAKESTIIVDKQYDGFLVTTGFAVIVPKPNIDVNYLHTMLRSKFLQKQIEQRTTGTIMESVSLKELEEITLPCPTTENQKASLNIFSVYKEKSDKIRKEMINSFNQLNKIKENFEDNLIKIIRN